MSVLSSELRRDLEKAVVAGRKASEVGCRAVLSRLGVTEEKRPGHLSEVEAGLRVGLRAKHRQLGGDVDVLVGECAFEQWHRLLFARFLSENGLLLEPESRAPVSLAECEELAEELGEPDGWAVAGRFAAEILPGIFRLDDPCVRLRLAPEDRVALERIVDGLPTEVFTSDDGLGWVYQFWQKEKKDEVNASERKIGGADLGPVTQLFTENYMVRFLLENSLGAWWAARHPDSPLLKEWEFLRFDDEGLPAAGAFEEWPERVAEVTVMDPCCGSGHFLVEAFGMLWRMRAEEEGLDPVAAQDAVLRDNLFGLELDPRCVQIAMFAVALAAWKAGGNRWRELPVPHVACSGIPVRAPLENWKALAGGDPRLEAALERLHGLFRHADTLGSLIDPRRAARDADDLGQPTLMDVDWDEVAPLLEQAAYRETEDPATAVLGATAASTARAAGMLSRPFNLVATNPPFLSKRRMNETMVDGISRNISAYSRDLATAMMGRFSTPTPGTVEGFVSPQSWLFIAAFDTMRAAARRSSSLVMIARLGARAFESISGEVVNVILTISDNASSAEGAYLVLDANDQPDPSAKSQALRSLPLLRVVDEPGEPGEAFPLSPGHGLPALGEYAGCYTGLQTGDDPQHRFLFWEVNEMSGWRPEVSSDITTATVSGRYSIVRWPNGSFYRGRPSAHLHAQDASNRPSVMVRLMGGLPVTLWAGDLWHQNLGRIVPNDPNDLPTIWAFGSSADFAAAVRSVDSSLKVTPSSFLRVPFDVDHWRRVAAERFPDGLPEPWSDDPTQWLFEGRPEVATEPLQVGVGRLLGFRWPEQAESDDLDELADADGIVCLPAVGGEAPAADRLQALLARAFGEGWGPGKVGELLAASGAKQANLADWLRDEFFVAHCKLFHHRPFVWHVWDGRKDGFSALVNYHRLDHAGLQKLTYTYLGSWIERQRAEARDEVAGADERLGAAEDLQRRLKLILEGEPPYDIYVRWKELADQPVGWNPDLDDGVRLNVRPFVEAGVLRSKFNVKWTKDRGKNPDGSERLNDLHFTTAEKLAARQTGR